MSKIFNILDEELIKEIETKKAKENKSIKEHTEDLFNKLDILKEYGYIEDYNLYDLVEKACLYHDLGKLNREFQNRINKGCKFDKSKEIFHNILSIYFINKDEFEVDDYFRVMYAVLNHHNYSNNVYKEIKENKVLINELLSDFKVYNIKKAYLTEIANMSKDLKTKKVKGYLHKCDYAASGDYIPEYKNDFLLDSLDRLMNKWRKNNKNANWNELQNFCIENRDENIIAVAQTGMGKTEGGLLWIGNNKGFFVLPLRTAINAIYDRIRIEMLEENELSEELSKRLSILHSSSIEYYLNNLNNNTDEKEKMNIIEYNNMGKRLSIPLNISTMDQLFDFVFKYQGYELKLTTLSYSKIVIDEIQMYSPDLLAYLVYGIEQIVEMGGKVAILTATLPPFIKDLLKDKINFKEGEFTNDKIRHNVKVIDNYISSEDIYLKYIENKRNSKPNKILVVCNTIRKAQEIYRELKEKVDCDDLHILHSRFTKEDRRIKEKKIIEAGKTFNSNGEIDNRSEIWIATSIVEASLDIDFDYLFTELKDLNSLFQRMGRVNRKGKKDISNHNIYVYLDIDSRLLKSSEDFIFIDKTIYNLSRDSIHEFDGVISEKEKIGLINKYFTSENINSSNYMKIYRNSYESVKTMMINAMKEKDVKLRNIQTEDIIPGPVYEKHLDKIKEIEEKLMDKSISREERIKLKDEMMKFTVSVNYIDICSYNGMLKKGQAITYSNIRLSDYEYIKVIDSEYDDEGYKKLYSDNVNINTELL